VGRGVQGVVNVTRQPPVQTGQAYGVIRWSADRDKEHDGSEPQDIIDANRAAAIFAEFATAVRWLLSTFQLISE